MPSVQTIERVHYIQNTLFKLMKILTWNRNKQIRKMIAMQTNIICKILLRNTAN